MVATEAETKTTIIIKEEDFVQKIYYANKLNLYEIIKVLIDAFILNDGCKISMEAWNLSQYSPTPTIIEAAKTLYSGNELKLFKTRFKV